MKKLIFISLIIFLFSCNNKQGTAEYEAATPSDYNLIKSQDKNFNKTSYLDYYDEAIRLYYDIGFSSGFDISLFNESSELKENLSKSLDLNPNYPDAWWFKYIISENVYEKFNSLENYFDLVNIINKKEIPITFYGWKKISGGNVSYMDGKHPDYLKCIEEYGSDNEICIVEFEKKIFNSGEIIGQWEEGKIKDFNTKRNILQVIVNRDDENTVLNNLFANYDLVIIKFKDGDKNNELIAYTYFPFWWDIGNFYDAAIPEKDKNEFSDLYGNFSWNQFTNENFIENISLNIIDSIFPSPFYPLFKNNKNSYNISYDNNQKLGPIRTNDKSDHELYMELALKFAEDCDLSGALTSLNKAVDLSKGEYEPFFARGLLREGRDFDIGKNILVSKNDPETGKINCSSSTTIENINIYSDELALLDYKKAYQLYKTNYNRLLNSNIEYDFWKNSFKKYTNFKDLYNSKSTWKIPAIIRQMNVEFDPISKDEQISISDIEISWSECYFEGKNYIERVLGYVVMDHKILDDGIIYYYVTGTLRDNYELKQGKLQFTQSCKVKGM